MPRRLCCLLLPFAIVFGLSCLMVSVEPLSARASKLPKVDKSKDPWSLGPSGISAIVLGKALKVVSVSKGSPADGKVNAGELITRAGGKSFSTSPVRGFMAALANAQEPPKEQDEEKKVEFGKLHLSVKRNANDPQDVNLEIPIIGAKKNFHQADNPKAAALLTSYLDWLKGQQVRGAWRAGLSWTNGVAATTSMAGLAMLAHGGEAYQESIKQSAAWLIANVNGSKITTEEERKGAPNWNQDNWAWSMAGLFLAEYWRVSKDEKVFKKLGTISEAILKNQQANGGWAHGPGGPNALKYTDFVQMTLQCVLALQSIQACGIETPNEPITKAKAYVLATQDRHGGIGYSAKKTGALGYSECGRTAFASLVFADDEANKKAWMKMRNYVYQKRSKAREGHASGLMHLTWASLSLYRYSKEGARKLMTTHRWVYEASQLPDGGGIAQPNKETLKIGRNFDRANGRPWATACLALSLAARHKRLWLQGADVKAWERPEEAEIKAKDKPEKAKD